MKANECDHLERSKRTVMSQCLAACRRKNRQFTCSDPSGLRSHDACTNESTLMPLNHDDMCSRVPSETGAKEI